MEKVFVAKRVAAKLFSTEAAVDAAMVEASELLSEARSAMVGVHGELTEAKLRLGIRTKLGLEDKPVAAAPAATTLRDFG